MIINALKEDVPKQITKETSGSGADIVVECVGVEDTFFQAVEVFPNGGKLMQLGVFEKPFLFNPRYLISQNIRWIACLIGEYPGAMEPLRNGKVKVETFITHTFQLEEAQETLET